MTQSDSWRHCARASPAALDRNSASWAGMETRLWWLRIEVPKSGQLGMALTLFCGRRVIGGLSGPCISPDHSHTRRPHPTMPVDRVRPVRCMI
ncbi:hypothetical protein TCAP_01002 [Tolypocladium capitatum]|uniref:Uncharacterized protein n=1 Tax=Tolypocladium capitatum TaxID=45235 RepID=A0A2K3QNH2_9HYPO|nr:hypothetical protein TCAP_01002 [Tolypocladium capitatum]